MAVYLKQAHSPCRRKPIGQYSVPMGLDRERFEVTNFAVHMYKSIGRMGISS